MAFFNFPFHIAKDKPAIAAEVQTNFDELRIWMLDNLIQKDGSVAMEGPLVLAPGAPASGEQTVNKAYVDAIIPIGTIWEYGGPPTAGGPPPAGWLWCDGQTYSEGSQQALFNAIKRNFTAAAVPTGSFQVPDKRGKFSMGVGPSDPLGKGSTTAAGQRDGELLQHQHANPAHEHVIQAHGHTASSDSQWTDHLHDFGGATDTRGNHNHGLNHGTLVRRHNPNGGEGGVTNPDGQRYDNITHLDQGDHAHNFSGTTAGVRAGYPNAANHSHGITVNAQVAFWTNTNTGATTSDMRGAGTTLVDKNLPPYVAVNYMIYAGPV